MRCGRRIAGCPRSRSARSTRSRTRARSSPPLAGAAAQGTDIYVAATKLVLSQGLVVGATARWTRANQFGLLAMAAIVAMPVASRRSFDR
ncbi:DUF3034 family protein [Sphingomonas sp. MMS24-JH45]